LLVTMAFGLLFAITATQWSSLTDGTDGLVGIGYPDLGFSINWDAKKYYYMVLSIVVLCYYVLHRIVHSAFGTALIGVRMNEPRMRSLGFQTWRLKYVVVVMGGAFAGLAGVLYAHFYGNMVPSYMGLQMSAMPMLMVVMGGRGTLYGPCVAAAVIVLAQHYAGIYAPDRWPLILGVMFVLCVLLLRGGIASHLAAGWARVRFVRSRPRTSDDLASREGER
jgi:branched-chain amino acid transport system permease protein